MNELNEMFEGLAFPVITVRLANNKGRASMETYDDAHISATLGYSYDQRDGQPFALKCAQAVWVKHVRQAEARDLGDLVDRDPVFVPGNAGYGKGYVFTVLPSQFFGGDQ